MKKRIVAWLLGLLTEEGFVFAFGSVYAVADLEINNDTRGKDYVRIRGVTLKELRKMERKYAN